MPARIFPARGAAFGLGFLLLLLLLLLPLRDCAGSDEAPKRWNLWGLRPDFPPWDERAIGTDGILAKAAERALAQAPDSVETMAILVRARHNDEALGVLERIIERHPEAIARALEAFLYIQAPSRQLSAGPDRVKLRELTAAIRKRLPKLSRKNAASALRDVLAIERTLGGRTPEPKRVAIPRTPETVESKLFAGAYAGTQAALEFQLDSLEAERAERRIVALHAFASEHPGTVAGARALYGEGEALAMSAETGEPDPTERLLRIFAIIRELESGSFPECEWTGRAPSLVRGAVPRPATYAPGNLDRVLAAFQQFACTHPMLGMDSQESAQVLLGTMGGLYEKRGDGEAGLERALLDLERTAKDPGALEYLRALFYTRPDRPGQDRSGCYQKAEEILSALARKGNEPYRRRAASALASLHFYLRDYAGAIPAYRTYLDRYPQSDWSWLATLRLGQSLEAFGETGAAVTEYRAAGESDSLPLALVFGHLLAGRADERLGRFEEALADDRAALEAWDADYGYEYGLSSVHPNPLESATGDPADVRTTRETLAGRIVVLTRSLALPEGSLLERGRWLVDRRRWDDARVPLETLLKEHPDSPEVPSARYLYHLARLGRALDLADVESENRNEPAAMEQLLSLAGEPIDFAVVAAGIARASILWKQDKSAAARALMKQTMADWSAWQAAQPGEPQSSLDEDASAMVEALFPRLGAKQGSGRHFIARSTVRVSLSDGEMVHPSVRSSRTWDSSVLFVDDEQLRLLAEIMDKLGGTARCRPADIMAVPNHPVGPSQRILAFWNEFFPAGPGHWMGWVFESYPRILNIGLSSPERTRGRAMIDQKYEGPVIGLEKMGGVWKTYSTGTMWIE